MRGVVMIVMHRGDGGGDGEPLVYSKAFLLDLPAGAPCLLPDHPRPYPPHPVSVLLVPAWGLGEAGVGLDRLLPGHSGPAASARLGDLTCRLCHSREGLERERAYLPGCASFRANPSVLNRAFLPGVYDSHGVHSAAHFPTKARFGDS